eukprot:Gb_25183 [translate_table: standard]
MKKMVLKVEIQDSKSKSRALQAVAGVQGVDSVSIDMKEKKITVIGEADPVFLTAKLRKFGYTDLLSVGPAKEEKKDEKKPPEKKDEKKPPEKKEEKKETPPTIVYVPFNHSPCVNHSPYEGYSYKVVSDENPSACVIC